MTYEEAIKVALGWLGEPVTVYIFDRDDDEHLQAALRGVLVGSEPHDAAVPPEAITLNTEHGSVVLWRDQFESARRGGIETITVFGKPREGSREEPVEITERGRVVLIDPQP